MKGVSVLIRKVWEKKDAGTLPPLTLAYIGDTVYDLYVRSYLVKEHTLVTGELNKIAISFVSAEGQAKAAHGLEPLLTEEERDFLRRGRNAKSSTHAKNASIQDYRMATGLETLIGYLYLTGQDDRIDDLMKSAAEIVMTNKAVL